MDARDLLSGDATFIADTSAWWRAAALPNDLAELLQAAILEDRMLITPLVRMDILYSARTSNEIRVAGDRAGCAAHSAQ